MTGRGDAEGDDAAPISPSDRVLITDSVTGALHPRHSGSSPPSSPSLSPGAHSTPSVRARYLREKLNNIEELTRRASGGGGGGSVGGGGSTSGDALLSSAEQRKVAARDALQEELDTLIALHPDLGTTPLATPETTPSALPPLTPPVEGLFDLDHLSTDLLTEVAEEPAEERTEPTGRAAKRAWPIYTLEEVGTHRTHDDAWIVVHDRVYDMTAHVRNHEGWTHGGKQSTLLAILSACGQDCTHDFDDVHSPHAHRQLAAFQIGVLDTPNTGCRYARLRTWEQLQAEGVAP